MKDPLADLASAFSDTYLYGEELYNTLKNLKVRIFLFYFPRDGFFCASRRRFFFNARVL